MLENFVKGQKILWKCKNLFFTHTFSLFMNFSNILNWKMFVKGKKNKEESEINTKTILILIKYINYIYIKILLIK
jgi:hypothetical protein